MLFSKWNSLPLATRNMIATAFGVARVGYVHVFNNTIQNDGYKFQDIEKALTVAKLQEYLASKEKDFDTLWEALVNKTEGRDYAIKVEIDTKDWKGVIGSHGTSPEVEPVKKKHGRPAKKTTGK